MEELQESFFDEDYEVILDNYQGPIELLYSLVKESKMSIDEVKLGELTAQYLEHMKQMPELDIEEATKFIQVVAILLEIKTKMILPQEAEEVEDENDTEYLMKLLLKEYEILHEATEELSKKENNNYFYKEPDKIVTEYKVVLGDMKMDDMLDAFAKMLAKLNEKEREQIIEREIPKDRWTVAEKIDSISNTLREKKNCTFSSFFEDGYSRGEVITVFLALLELLKRHFVKVSQENNFDDINIVYNEEYPEIVESQNENTVDNYN